MKGILFYADDKLITAKTGRIVMGHKSKRTYDKVFEDRKNMLEDLILHNDLYVPMKTKELAILMQVPKEDRHELQAVLDSLVAEGRIGVSKKGKYSKPENTAIIGIYQKTSRGFGFVVVEGREDDIFIKESDDGGAFHMDKVMVAITAEKHGDKRCEGKIIKILEHQIKEVVGTYQKSKTFGFVVPDNKKICYDIFVPQEKSMGAVTGHKVVVELTSYGTLKKNPEGRVKEIIGHINDPGTDIMSIIKAYDLPMEFPESVMKSLNDIPDELSPKDYAGRVDLRDLQTVTIDGEDAKDLDDAITVSEENGIYHLGVHIADVSNYVKEYSPLDKEAYKRGTSVYLVDRVIPMLPHKLSNGICSLNQGCDRLALSCLMDIDEKGNVIASAMPGGNTHGSICKIGEQWYVFYHRQIGTDCYARQAMVSAIDVKVEKGKGGKVVISRGEFNSEGFLLEGLNPMQRISAGLACWHTNPGGIKEVYPHYVYTGSYIRPVYRDNNPYAGDNNHKIPFAPVVNNTSGSIVGYKYLNMNAVPRDKSLQMQLRLKAEDTDGRIRIMLGSPWTTKGGVEIGLVNVKAGSTCREFYASLSIPAKLHKGKQPLFFVFESETEGQSICEFYDFLMLARP